MLSSKVVYVNQKQYPASPHHARYSGKTPSGIGGGRSGGKDDASKMTFPTSNRTEHVVEVHGGSRATGAASRHRRRASSEERIFSGRAESSGMANSDVELDAMEPSGQGISKTVEFEVEVSKSRRSMEPCPPPSTYEGWRTKET
jgi:hypothetical protein